MKDEIESYLEKVTSKFAHEETSEMGYRTAFETLLKQIFAEVNGLHIYHDPKVKNGNKPDFVILQDRVPLVYIETKDIGKSLDKVEKSEQMSRYFGYANLVLTDYLEFRFYRNGDLYGEPIKIAEYSQSHRSITAYPDQFDNFYQTLKDFHKSYKEPIKSGKHLSKIMAGKAQRIRDNIREFLKNDSDKNAELIKVFQTIKELLVHDLELKDFSDMYAQTLVYGLFVARFYDESPENFSRQEARDLIPKSNPLLRHFFDHIVGPNFDKRLEIIVDELCEVFTHADVEKLMEDYYKKDDAKKGPDPVIHFYEDFLAEYDPQLRKKMGAYYTPLPVVEYITRSVDEILKKEFKLSGGLADTSKTKDGVHKVQVLDPAVGTGTFYSAVIGEIYKKFKGQKGRWPAYVHNDLLPRIHGFELMMAPYTIAHLKLALAFKETGFKYFNNRLNLFLTNSLENEVNQGKLFTAFGLADSIAQESKEAMKIKNETPIMVVIGNPPYSVSSSNKGEWIENLTKDYKKDLNERNIQPLSDDYIKFIRFAEHFIEKNGIGVVAMITNNSFLDGIIHRQMRKHLLETFDKIYILDLHGNAKKKEIAPDGGKDENVFDIQQGVSINIFVKKGVEKNVLGEVYHADLYGQRAHKFESINKSNLDKIKWEKLENSDPYYFFVPKNFEAINEYEEGFRISKIFKIYSSGIKTHRDAFVIDFEKEELKKRIENFINPSTTDTELRTNYKLNDNRDWSLSKARKMEQAFETTLLKKILYKPFDYRYIYFSSHLIDFDRRKVMSNLLHENLGLSLMRKPVKAGGFRSVMACDSLMDVNFWAFQSYLFPLYIYDVDDTKTSNLKEEIVDEIENIVGKTSPENIFDYIYAVLHSPSYREKYKEFLKIDFPRVPYPKDKDSFNKLVKLGGQLRELHLLESEKVNDFNTTYPVAGSDIVEKPIYKSGNVYINHEQYFGNVPEVAWKFWIGGYQPAQKWLKDRKGKKLTNEELEHYQRMIVALVETDRLMKEIDNSSKT